MADITDAAFADFLRRRGFSVQAVGEAVRILRAKPRPGELIPRELLGEMREVVVTYRPGAVEKVSDFVLYPNDWETLEPE